MVPPAGFVFGIMAVVLVLLPPEFWKAVRSKIKTAAKGAATRFVRGSW